MRQQRPLTDDELADLAEIRRNRAIRDARREIDNAHHFDGAGKLVIGVAVVFFLVGWPEIFFHREPVVGHFTLTRTGWIVEIVWLGLVAAVVTAWLVNRKRHKGASGR